MVVCARGVQDRDAEAAVGVDVGVVEGAEEFEFWGVLARLPGRSRRFRAR